MLLLMIAAIAKCALWLLLNFCQLKNTVPPWKNKNSIKKKQVALFIKNIWLCFLKVFPSRCLLSQWKSYRFFCQILNLSSLGFGERKGILLLEERQSKFFGERNFTSSFISYILIKFHILSWTNVTLWLYLHHILGHGFGPLGGNSENSTTQTCIDIGNEGCS